MSADADVRATESLPAPRLQLRWALPTEQEPSSGVASDMPESDGYRRWICHYELVLPLREHDIRRERDDAPEFPELVIPISKTNRGSTTPPNSEPYRDGAHASWDAQHLGNLPIYVLPFAGPAVLLSDLRVRREAVMRGDATRPAAHADGGGRG